MHYQLQVLGNNTSAIQASADHFLAAYRKAIAAHDHFFVALSGGSTPKPIYEILTHPPYSKEINWAKISLFWSDERSVPPDHKENNYKMAMDAGFGEMPIPSHQIHRMHAESHIQQHALQYDKLMQELKRPLDLVLLGMGEDGHTASLFPGTEALTSRDRFVVANFVPQKNTWRMTFTFPWINLAKEIAIHVFGSAKKSQVLEAFTNEKMNYPIQRVGTAQNPALWILDEDAAQELLSH